MVTLPDGFVTTWYPGYFWHIPSKQLYSLKVDGVLKPLKLIQPNYFNGWDEPAYRVSHKGQYRVMRLSRLWTLRYSGREQIPVQTNGDN